MAHLERRSNASPPETWSTLCGRLPTQSLAIDTLAVTKTSTVGASIITNIVVPYS